MIVVPWPLASSRTATSAVIADGLTGSPRSSTTKHAVGVAVEGQADVGAVLADGRLQVDQVRRVQRVGLVVGEASRRARSTAGRSPAAGRTRTTGTVCPPMPLPASTTTFSGRMPDRSTSAVQVGGVLGEHVALADRADAGSGVAGRRRRARPTRGCRPARSPARSARRPARHILMPLYCAGLWLAVNIAPGRSSEPAAKYSRSVEPEPGLDDVDAAADHALGEGPRERDRGVAHVVGGDDGGRAALGDARTRRTRRRSRG